MRKTLAGVVVLAALWGATAAADAQGRRKTCYENFAGGGCPWSLAISDRELAQIGCDELAEIRNRTLSENGFCFKNPALRARYGDNRGCKWPIEALVPLNRHERRNTAAIKRIERSKRCG